MVTSHCHEALYINYLHKLYKIYQQKLSLHVATTLLCLSRTLIGVNNSSHQVKAQTVAVLLIPSIRVYAAMCQKHYQYGLWPFGSQHH